MFAGLIGPFRRPKSWLFSLLVVGLMSWGLSNYKLLRPFPGPLSAQQSRQEPLAGFHSHAMFEEDCTHCHVAVHCLSDDRCQSCHRDVALERQEARGLHGQLLVGANCRDCHSEHQGREAQITRFIIASEEHTARTSFSLELHRINFGGELIDCGNCHVAGSATAATVDCLTCHVAQDHDAMAAHVEQFGTGCLLCHDGRQREEPFSHERFFILDGAHETAECAACHDSYQAAAPTRLCHDCHQEPDLHAGSFGLDCRRCHTTADDWRNARLTLHTFPLDHGDEGQLACESCHRQSYVAYTCDDCHTLQEMFLAHVEERDDPGYAECAGCHVDGQRASVLPEP
jgi:hypothetical protein